MLVIAVAALIAAAEADDAGYMILTGEPPAEAIIEGADAGEPPGAEPIDPSANFVKGELSVFLGSDRLTVKNNRIGVSAGVDQFGSAYYLLVEPQVDLRFFDGKWGVGLGVPLRIELLSFERDAEGDPFRYLGRIRTKDWDTFHDFGRLLKYVNFGRKEDNLYVNIGQRYASTIGHGTIQRRYAANIDIDYPRVSAEVDAYNDFGGFELFTNDILAWNQLAGIAFIKPLWFLKSDNLLVKSLSIGVSGGLDWDAPVKLRTNSLGVRQIADGRLLADSAPAGIVGFDVEMKVYKDDHIDVKPYVDYSFLVGGEGGLTLGALGRFNVGTSTVNAFRLVAELRILGSHYKPGYFDTFYEVERFIYDDAGRNGFSFFDYRTKLDAILNGGLGARQGYYFEASWGIRNAVGVTLSLEGVSNSAAKNFVAHVELPLLSFLQVFGSFYKRRFGDFAEFGNLDEKTVLFAGARLKILPFFFLNGRVYKAFRMNPDVQRYDNQLGFVIDAEVGYEFGGKKEEQKPER